VSPAAFGRLVWIETLLFVREPIAVFFTLGFPLIPLLLFGTLYGKHEAMAGFRVIDVYVPAVLSTVVGYLAFMGLPIALAEYREQGVLKRYRASPVPLQGFLAAHVAVQAAVLLPAAAIIVLVAHLAFGIRFDFLRNLGAVTLVLGVGTASLFTIGFFILGICGTTRTTMAVSGATFFFMLFLSGAAIPRREFPPWLRDATDFVPLAQLVDPLTRVWTGEALVGQWTSLLYLVALAIAALIATRRTFRWSV